jgi:hypothetical protein
MLFGFPSELAFGFAGILIFKELWPQTQVDRLKEE